MFSEHVYNSLISHILQTERSCWQLFSRRERSPLRRSVDAARGCAHDGLRNFFWKGFYSAPDISPPR